MSFKGLRMLKIPKLPDFEKYWKSSKNIQRGDPWKKIFFSFLFNTLFYTRQSYKTIRMSFGGLRMLKSPNLTQCYSFASVRWRGWSRSVLNSFFQFSGISSNLRLEAWSSNNLVNKNSSQSKLKINFKFSVVDHITLQFPKIEDFQWNREDQKSLAAAWLVLVPPTLHLIHIIDSPPCLVTAGCCASTGQNWNHCSGLVNEI